VAVLVPAAAFAGTCETQTSNCLVKATDFGAVEGKSFTGEVAQARDYSGDGLKEAVHIDWGDGTSTNQAVPATGKHGAYVTITATHTYAEEGSYTTKVRLILRKADGTTCPAVGCQLDGAQGTATVADAALTATGVSSSPSSRSFSGIVAKFTDADPAGTASDYSAVIDWGDGSTPSAGTIGAAPSGNGFVVGAKHNFVGGGAYAVTTTIKDAGGSTAVANATLTVPKRATALTADPAIVQLTPSLDLRLGNLRAHLTQLGPTAPLAGKTISFTAGGTAVCSATTDSTGTATCGGLIPEGLDAILALGYEAHFAGDGAYLPSNASGALIG
jgi:hypothetical protein